MTTNPPADAAKLVKQLHELSVYMPGYKPQQVYSLIKGAADLLAAQASQIEALTAKVSELRDTRDKAIEVIGIHRDRATAAEAKAAKMREALKPFISEFGARRDAYIRRYPQNPGVGARNFDAMPDEWKMEGSKFSMGDFRRALAALDQEARP